MSEEAVKREDIDWSASNIPYDCEDDVIDLINSYRNNQQNKDANIFIKDIAVMLGMDIDGIGFDGLKFSIEDFEDAIKSLNK